MAAMGEEADDLLLDDGWRNPAILIRTAGTDPNVARQFLGSAARKFGRGGGKEVVVPGFRTSERGVRPSFSLLQYTLQSFQVLLHPSDVFGKLFV